MPTSGLLHVTMQPQEGLPEAQFHDWYNNEHGPNRLRLPEIFASGLRYRATDDTQPKFLAQYDVTDMSLLESDTYTSLRANRTKREAETIAQVNVHRRFFDFVHEKAVPDFTPPEKLPNKDAQGLVSVQVFITLTDAADASNQYQDWYIKEHIELLAKVPGWQRSRLFRTSSLEDNGKFELFCQHDYKEENGLGGPEHKASMDTTWREEVFTKYVASKGRREYELFYVFGPAPRDLDSLSKLGSEASFKAPDSRTKTVSGKEAAIASYVTTSDSLAIQYRLEGNPSGDAPTVAFSNSLLTCMHMWDRFLEIFKQARPDFRILRYDQRGRHAIPQPPKAATMDMLADDLRQLLDALRIDKLHALIGVSMGGATTLNFGLQYSNRVERLVACDCNYKSSEANTKAWGERSRMAEAGQMRDLADATVKRWFHPNSVENGPLTQWMIDEVASNDVQGFTHSNTALCDFNLEARLSSFEVPCLLIAGDQDGKGAIAQVLEGAKDKIGSGALLKIVSNAGHLPMYETPEAFWEAIREFLV